METKISTGSAEIDWLLEGGYEKDVITTFYGPAGSGKTNLCLIAMASVSKDKKIIYIDSEGGFSVVRLKQITDDYKDVLNRTIFLNPVNFEEQEKSFEQLKKLVSRKIGLIIFDSAAMLYRLEIGKTKNVYNVNKVLGIQLSYLTEIARRNNIPVLITNQVYTDFDDKNKIKMVGGDILKYSSKCLIELRKKEERIREATLAKHRSLPDGKKIEFRIVDSGTKEVQDSQKSSTVLSNS